MKRKLRDDGAEDFSPEMYDTSDVTFDMPTTKSRRKVHLIASSKSDFNLVRYYLALKGFVEKIERELDIMEEASEPQ